MLKQDFITNGTVPVLAEQVTHPPTHPPTHPHSFSFSSHPTQCSQHLIRTASFSSTQLNHPPTHFLQVSTAPREKVIRVALAALHNLCYGPITSTHPYTHPPTHIYSPAPHSNRLVLLHPPIHPPPQKVSTAPREKVIRVALAALHNLCYGRLDVLNAEMVGCGLPKTLENLLDRKWTDQELKADLEHLHEALQKDSRELSTFERYVAEVASGQLRWGIVHTEKFWKENVRALEVNDFKILK